MKKIICSFRLIVREFGAKNAKLICIKDENSICETEPEPLDENKDEEKHKNNELVRVSSQTQTETIKASNKMNVKISRLPKKELRTLELLPKDHIFKIAQYKLGLYDYNKSNCLYMKSAVMKPWLLMGK